MDTFGERLQYVMRIKKINVTGLAEQYGCDKSQISRWRGRKKTPDVITVDKLSNILQCDAHWLETGEGEPFQSNIQTSENEKKFKTRDDLSEADEIKRTLFLSQCPGFFADFFEYIADCWGASKDGAEAFLNDYQNNASNTEYRLWLAAREKGKERTGTDN